MAFDITAAQRRRSLLNDLRERIVDSGLAEAAKRADEARRLANFIRHRRERSAAIAAALTERRGRIRLLAGLGLAPAA